MLRELRNVRQIDNENHRRVFSDEDMDLTVWIAAGGELSGFELCYDKKRCERALRWKVDEGYLHQQVDDGERHFIQHKASPILVPDGIFDSKKISRLFHMNSRDIDVAIADFVFCRLSEYPD